MDNSPETPDQSNVETLKQVKKDIIRKGLFTTVGFIILDAALSAPGVYTRFFNPSFLKDSDEVLQSLGLPVQMADVFLAVTGFVVIVTSFVAVNTIRNVKKINKKMRDIQSST